MLRAAAVAVALLLGAAAACAEEKAVVVPAGAYTPFGREKAPASASVAGPVQVAAFRLDVEPVTNGEFLAFVEANPKWRKSAVSRLFADARYLRRWPSDLALVDAQARDEPVVNVSWCAAQAYCKWRGGRLPATEQWEYALADAGRGAEDVQRRSLQWFAEPNRERPRAVGGAPNGFGLRDMVGLVWEWTLDFNAFAVTTDTRDSSGKDSAQFCGGAAAGVADAANYPAFMRYAMRSSLKANYTVDNVGFRCAGAVQ